MFFDMGRTAYVRMYILVYQILSKKCRAQLVKCHQKTCLYTQTLFHNPGILLVGHDIVQRAPLLREKFSRMVQEEAKSSRRPLAALGWWLEWEPKTKQADHFQVHPTKQKINGLIVPEDCFQVLALFKANSKG